MSELIKKLTSNSVGTARQMGFGVISRKDKKEPILIACFCNKAVEDAAEFIKGADAVALSVEMASVKTAKGVVRGGWQKNGGKTAKGNYDFTISSIDNLPPDTTESEMGRILELDDGLEDTLIRTINNLPAQAVLVKGKEAGNPLSWRRLMIYRRFVDMLSKPLLVAVSAEVTIDQLKLLWGVGINGFFLTLDKKEDAGKISQLRRQMKKENWQELRHKKSGYGAVLPAAAQEVVTPEEEIEEPEEEEI
jgi:hypothetical protein